MVARIYRKAASWPQRKGGNGYMPISIGSHNHTDHGLCHMIDWINAESGFSFLRIGLSDTLNRFNETGSDARDKARLKGDAWLAQNSRYLSRLAVPYELIRWDHWENTYPEAVERNRQHYRDAFRTIPEFREAMLADMDRFSRRRDGVPLNPSNMQGFHDYLIEELGVYEEIYRGFPSTTIYPGNQAKVIEFLRNGDLSETFPQTRYERLYIPSASPQAFPAAHAA